jgi:hypothetical protein
VSDTSGAQRAIDMTYRWLSVALAAAIVALGVAMIAVTAVNGGGELGFLLGALFIAAGLGRIYLMRRI